MTPGSKNTSTRRAARLSVLIPVYNEEKTILEVLHRVQAVELPIEKEIIIVDDGSSDRTPELLADAQRDGNFRLHLAPVNRSKGASIRAGIPMATGDIVLIQDADLEIDPAEYPILIAPLLDGRAEVVYGSRFSKGRNKAWSLSYLANHFLVLLTNVLYGGQITDMETCYKVFLRDVIQGIELTCRRFEFEPEVTAKVLRMGYRIFEVPISYSPRTSREGKKIRAKDGLQAVYHLLKWRLVSRKKIQRATKTPKIAGDGSPY